MKQSRFSIARLFVVAYITLAFVLSFSSAGLSADPVQETPQALEGSIDKIEQEVLEEINATGRANFFIVLAERADLSPAYQITDWEARGRFVYDTLQDTAQRSQAPIIAELERQGVSYRSFSIVNAIFIEGGDQGLLNTLSKRENVANIYADQILQIFEPQLGDKLGQVIETNLVLETNIAWIYAHWVWQNGWTGQDIVIANIDTGVQYDHPALVKKYRGNQGNGLFNHNHNWADFTSECSQAQIPCDNNGHGTHTLGTIVGDAEGDDHRGVIGVAPGSRWITAKACNQAGECMTTNLIAAAEWILAPTNLDGTGADPAMRPHVVNNSWGGPGSDPWFMNWVDSWRAAGIFSAFAAGNDGPSCGTSNSPGDYPQSFGVGAIAIPSNNIWLFSSRGPSLFNVVKPDVSAPGMSISSSWPAPPGSDPSARYRSQSGTSTAAPHVAGVVALLWSAYPALIGQVDLTGDIIEQSAAHNLNMDLISFCGPAGWPNNVYGHGLINAWEAYNLAAGTPTPCHIIVKSNADNGRDTLREAIARLCPGGTIEFAFTELTEINLTSGELVIDKYMTINGPGGDILTISGGNVNRVFEVSSGVTFNLKNLIVSGGYTDATDEPMGGGGIRNFGEVNIDNCNFTDNYARYGGAIRNQGTMTINQTNFTSNNATYDGGAIFNGGTATINGSIIGGDTPSDANQALGGAGILNWGAGTVEIIDSDIIGNQATLSGGGIENGEGGMVMIKDGSRIINNSALADHEVHGGGGIRNFGGTVKIEDSEVSNNTATRGGGIFNYNPSSSGEVAKIICDHSTASGNSGRYGGGIHSENGEVMLENCVVSDNAALGNAEIQEGIGGGIYNGSGMVTIRDASRVIDNTANSPNLGMGGGIYNMGDLTVSRSTVSGNVAGGWHYYYGGGIYNNGGIVALTQSTISGNIADGHYGLGDAGGGGIYNNSGVVDCTNSTISSNWGDVGTSGGGIYNLGSLKFINCTVSNNESYFSGGIDGGATLKNTIVAYNTAATPDSGNCVGTFTSQDYNLSSDSTCNLTTPNDMEDTDPLLSPLRDNGGPTWTHALLPGSPAINYIPVDQCFVDKDQRDMNRPQGPRCDIGAYEVENEDLEINEIYLPITMR